MAGFAFSFFGFFSSRPRLFMPLAMTVPFVVPASGVLAVAKEKLPLFKALWYPYGNYVVLAFVVLILGIMLMIPGIQVSVYAIPVWVAFMAVCYWAKNKRSAEAALSAANTALK